MGPLTPGSLRTGVVVGGDPLAWRKDITHAKSWSQGPGLQKARTGESGPLLNTRIVSTG